MTYITLSSLLFCRKGVFSIVFSIFLVSFAFCDYIMEKMFKNILSVLSLLYLVFVRYTLCVECWDTNFQTSVHGISEVQDFD